MFQIHKENGGGGAFVDRMKSQEERQAKVQEK